MNKPLTIDINGIGPVLLEHSRRAKRVSISIKAFKGVRVAVPPRVSFNKALEFVCMKKSWIQNHLAKITLHETESRAMADLSTGIDKAQAKRELTGRLSILAKHHGFTFNKVSLRNQKTRWGSCSRNNNISLNMKLVLLPEDLIDYVMLHELVHTLVPNHSKNFWGELDKYVGNSKAIASKLGKYDLGLP